MSAVLPIEDLIWESLSPASKQGLFTLAGEEKRKVGEALKGALAGDQAGKAGGTVLALVGFLAGAESPEAAEVLTELLVEAIVAMDQKEAGVSGNRAEAVQRYFDKAAENIDAPAELKLDLKKQMQNQLLSQRRVTRKPQKPGRGR